MSMCVRDVSASEEKCHAFYSPFLAKYWSQPLAYGQDFVRNRRRQGIEVVKVLAGNDLNVTRADGMNVEESDNLGRLVYQVCMNLTACDPAEEAFTAVGHGA